MIFTAVVLICGLLVFYLIVSTRSRSKNEPPLDKGLIPWLGHALEFGKDAAKFLTRMKKKHGDIFTVCVAGNYVTVLLDPSSYDDVLQDAVSLDFNRCSQAVVQRVFCLCLPTGCPAAQRAWMEHHFEGECLASLGKIMQRNIRALLSCPEILQNPADWKHEGLFSFCYRQLFKNHISRQEKQSKLLRIQVYQGFRAGYLTLFGKQKNNCDEVDTVYEEYRKFDGLLAKIARSTLKSGDKKMVTESREKLWVLLSKGKAKSGSWQESFWQFLSEKQADKETQRRAMLLQLWTTQCNAGPAVFWFLGYLLTNPEAMDAVMREIGSLSPPEGTRQGLSSDKLHNTPVFDSALRETLRLTAAVTLNREVLQPKTLRTADGREYDLRPGDRVLIFPYLSPQMDPKIHPEPEKFKYDRFLNADGTEKTDFFKNGRRLKYYTMPWGAGSNICVGRHFAVSAIKEFMFMVLTSLDLELCDPDSTMPPVNPSRYGFGILQPEGDLQIRYRMKRRMNMTEESLTSHGFVN